MDKKICKINDPRIVGYTNRTRSGPTQEFYTGTDARDWDRYKAEGGGSKPNVEMHLKPDTIHITPPKRSYYAKLIDGEWWWIEGCEECNGRERNDWKSYVVCDAHNVCRTCRTPSNDLPEGVVRWGGRSGWQCGTCRDAEHAVNKAAALAAMPSDEDFDEWDYRDLAEIKCPYCNYEFSDSWEYAGDDDQSHECPRCDNTFRVTAVQTVTFNCERKAN